MTKKKVTFADIAKYTGFSKTTISRYFNNPDSLTLENQEKIANALDVLGYKENKLAKVLANGKTEIVGVIVPNLYMHYYSEMLNQIIKGYEKYGYKFIVFAGNDNSETEKKYIEEMLAYNIEGLIVLSHTISSQQLASYNIPVVAIEREDKYVFSVNTDNYMGAVQATSLLAKSDCDILIHINDKVDHFVPSSKRIDGFIDICKDRNLRYEFIEINIGNTYSENYRNLKKVVLDLEKKYPTEKIGIFMSNDTYANVLLNVLIHRYRYDGFCKKFRIVGFDNSPISSQAVIPISTVGQQIEVIADEAMQLLVMQMNEQKKRKPQTLPEPIHKIVTPVLIRRNTTDID